MVAGSGSPPSSTAMGEFASHTVGKVQQQGVELWGCTSPLGQIQDSTKDLHPFLSIMDSIPNLFSRFKEISILIGSDDGERHSFSCK